MRSKITLAAAALAFLAVGAYPQAISFSLSSGLLLPKEEIYRDIYGQSVPVALEFRIGLGRNFGLAGGIEYLSDSGTAFNANQGEVDYPLRFRMISYPVSGYFLYPLGKFSLSLAAGISFHSYKEEWEDLDSSHEGKKSKPFFSGGFEYRFLPRVALRLLVRYESIATERSPFLQREVNLGGFSILGGITFFVR